MKRRGSRRRRRNEAVRLVAPAAKRVAISLVRYSGAELEERSSLGLKELEAARQAPGVKWLNVEGVHDPEVLATFGRLFALHPLVLEDISHTWQRAKIEDYGEYVYSCAKMLYLAEGELRGEQLSVILGKDYVITFQESEREGDVFGSLRTRLRNDKGQLRRSGSDFLFHAVLDAVVDEYYQILETHEESIAELEDSLEEASNESLLQQIHVLKKRTIYLRRSIWPMRELVGHLERREWPLFSRELEVFLRDLYDHAVRAIEMTESSMEMLGTMHDLSLSLVSNRLNRVMKVLTIISTIFIPLTFIAGVYGMNFRFMPEIEWRWGYPAVLLGMFITAGVMLVAFKRRKWF